MRYVAGFLFDDLCGTVLLIRKKRPHWQAGKLNGIGGHIERGEQASGAMVREFQEETGVRTSRSDWTQTVQLYGRGDDGKYWRVFFFYAISSAYMNEARTTTDEPLTPIAVDELRKFAVIPNLLWLVPMQFYPLAWPISLREITGNG